MLLDCFFLPSRPSLRSCCDNFNKTCAAFLLAAHARPRTGLLQGVFVNDTEGGARQHRLLRLVRGLQAGACVELDRE